jgi:uncharacterized Zn finger protein
MSIIPTINEQVIRALVGEASFQRGQQYYRGEAIFETRQQGMSLKARCEGSRSTAYRVEVTFNSKEIDSTELLKALKKCVHVQLSKSIRSIARG